MVEEEEIKKLLPGFKEFMGFVDELCNLSREEELARMKLDVEYKVFGPHASESPRHRHRIEMKRLDLEKIIIKRALFRMEQGRDEMLDVHQRILDNYLDWRRYLMTKFRSDLDRMILLFLEDEIPKARENVFQWGDGFENWVRGSDSSS